MPSTTLADARGDLSETPWSVLLEWERMKRATLREPEAGEAPDIDALREWWGIVEQIFRRMVVKRSELMPTPVPSDLFAVVASMAGYLSVGQVPGPVAHVAAKGRTSPGPTEERHIRMAVTYRRAVSDGLISDPRPTKTIADAYGLRSARTIQEWCREYKPLPGYAHFPDSIAQKMQQAGQIYQTANGRTWSAVEKKKAATPARK